MSRLPLTRVYISLKNLDHNLSLLRELAGGRPLWPAIKADAYGHGARIVASHLVSRGVDTFGVAQVQEALELAENGIDARFIILSPDLGDTAQEIAAHGLEPVVTTDIQLRALSREALRQGRDIRVHLKFDTGMGRVGFCPREADTVLARIAGYPGLKIAGFMSHFPRADEGDPEYSLEQLGRFRDIVEKTADFRDFETHMANSAAIFDVSGACFDACRPGIALYGLKPSSAIRNPRVDELKPVLSWKTAITQLKEVPPGTGLSYGHSYITSRQSLIATVPVGYGDGLARPLSNRIEMLVGGRRCRQVGTICMDQCLIDVSPLRGRVEEGDEVVIIGAQADQFIGAGEQAEVLGTINYEIVTRISGRVPRLAEK
ncbi:alanine racemase [Marispirochaeta aestuarii]|uniref:alanine racemase n=1 Tax=Marispirochaeta aestuarii TaxID=1963862 RepID=UPI0029C9B287|nr:alanine racemase [Marispirochaeta aestuarii]